MTARRMVRAAAGIATLILAATAWLVAARLLWRTEVPGDLELPRIDPGEHFPERLLRRTARHDGFLRVNFLLALAAQLAGIVLVAALAPRIEARLRGNALLRGLQLALIAGASAFCFRLPFGVAGQWWERRYDLSTQGWGEWLLERLPSPVGLLLLLTLVATGMGLARLVGRRWWLAGGPIVAALAVVAVLVQPLGGGLKPLREERLAADIRRLAAREGLGRVETGVEKASERTRRANAEVIGVGPTRTIVFWDTLLGGRFQRGQVRFVGAHEVAHLARRHAWRGLAWFALFALPCLYAVAAVAARRGGLHRPAAVPAALATAAALQLASLPVVAAITRRYEAEADWIALQATRDPASAEGLFERFAAVNLAEPRPPTWAYVLFEDHPSLVERIGMARAWTRSGR